MASMVVTIRGIYAISKLLDDLPTLTSYHCVVLCEIKVLTYIKFQNFVDTANLYLCVSLHTMT